MAFVQGEWLPLVDLQRIFPSNQFDAPGVGGLVAVAVDAGRKVALVARPWFGQPQVVVTNPVSPSARSEFVSGGALLGDGSVALILDAAALVRMGQNQRS